MVEIELNKRTPVERLTIANTLIESVMRELEQLNSEIAEKDEYIQDLEEECENLSEYNRLLVERIKEVN